MVETKLLELRTGLPRVWLVDDSPMEVELARRALGKRNEVEVFVEGGALLERLSTGLRPDVLVLDWHLPGLSGLEICKFIRLTSDEITLPILLLTASQGSSETVIEGLSAGANDYVRKPYEALELEARVRTLVRVSRLHSEAVSSRQQAEEAQRVHRRQMEQRIEFEQQLIGIVSHDLRTPLQTILMASTVLSRASHLDEASLKRVHRILSATQRASSLIRDLLDFTMARHGGRLPMTFAPANLHDVVHAAVEEAVHNHPERDIHFESQGEGAGMLDANRFAQVAGNLIGNAVKYSPGGSPVRVSTSELTDGRLKLEVVNHGEPLSATLIPRLFEPLTRGTHSGDSSTRSIGLGLFIVRQIVAAHGGTIDVRSSAAEGTVFTVWVPRNAA